MFRPQYVLIAADNTGRPVSTLDAARAAVSAGTAASAGGRLADGVLAADIDADESLIGDAVAEALISWCAQHDLPYLLRESGRPGGRHVIAVATNTNAPVQDWRKMCRQLGNKYCVGVDDRTGKVLRLLTAPHRVGLPSRVLSCTITPAAVVDRTGTAIALSQRSRSRNCRRSGTSLARTGDRSAGDRSAHEYGVACAMARRDYTTQQAHTELCELDGKVSGRTKRWFVRYIWLPAITTVAAERRLTETAAWELAQKHCGAECDRQGIDWWRGLWNEAIAEAAKDRPRRYRLPGESPASEQHAKPVELAAVRSGFRAAVDALLGGIDPRRRHSVHAALHALSSAIVFREGSMSLRDLSIRALIDLKTASRALATAVSHGLLAVTHSYTGGKMDCDAYGVGPAAEPHISEVRKASSHTSCSTPAPTGRCSSRRLTVNYARDRKLWGSRCDVLVTLAPGERLATSTSPAAKVLRSLHHQRQWWRKLSAEQKQQRTSARRAALAALGAAERKIWFDWLARRERIAQAADEVYKTPVSLAHGAVDALLTTPLTIYRGMADPRWRDSGTPTSMGGIETAPQLELSAA